MTTLEMKSHMNSGCDPLTEVLDIFPLPISDSRQITLTPPWGVHIPKRSALLCAVRRGRCWLTGPDMERPVMVSSGDMLVLSPAGEYRLQDSMDSRADLALEFADCLNSDYPADPEYNMAQTQLIGSVMDFNGSGIHPLCLALPPVLHLTWADTEQASEIAGILAAIEREMSATRLGGSAIVRRLSEILMAQMARHHLRRGGKISSGVLKGMVHQDLGPALSRIHRQPDQPWTVASLAEYANMSRSSFSATFTQVLDIPPLQYLREHRMRTASHLLQDSSLGLKEISSRVGYDSVSAFSMAFKRFSGMAPGDYRRRQFQGQ